MPRTDFVLETERLRLRPYRLDDLDAIAAVLGDAETMRYYPKPFTRDGARRWIDQNLARYRDDGYGLCYGVSELGIARFISLIRPIKTPSRRVAEKIGMVVEKVVPWGPDDWPHLVYAWPPPESTS
jgi:RimJ/RimL family protein N-acetyltransferase